MLKYDSGLIKKKKTQRKIFLTTHLNLPAEV
jgi:hypothetical protein